MTSDPLTVELTQTFHRRIAGIVSAVQAGIWSTGMHDLLGYSTDFGLGPKHGAQTLILKTSRRSAYVRLPWATVVGEGSAERAAVDEAIHRAIIELG
jgi:hypothetical protein